MFEELKFKNVILLTLDPKEIYKRLKKRDNNKYSLELIKKLQERERETCKKYCTQLGIEFLETSSTEARNIEI